MTLRAMTLQRFSELVEAYGAAFERWPISERASAEAFLASSAEAREFWEREALLDAELARQAPFALSAEFERRLAEIPVRHPQRSLSLFRRWLWAPALGWSLAAAAGIALGVSFADLDTDATSADETAQISADQAIDALALGDIADWEESAP